MKLKFLLTFSASLFLGLSAWAQSPIYLFKDYTEGTVALNNRSVVQAKFNYDTFHDKLLYMDGDQAMELSDFSDVLSVRIGERVFVPQGRSLYEVISLGECPEKLLIKWHQRKNPLGKKGAYDQVNHAGSAVSIDPEYYSISLQARGGEQVFDTIVENSYNMLMDGKVKRFNDKRSFLKLFPDKKDQIEAFVQENHLLFNKPEDVVQIATFAVSKSAE